MIIATCFLIFKGSLMAQINSNTFIKSEIKWSDEISNEISEEINSYLGLTKTQGAALAIVHNGEVLKKSFYGLANVEKGIEVSENSEFWLASVAKHLTTTLILDLEEDTVLSREDLITKYIPSLPETWNDIKISHLMSHTSGIIDNSYNNPNGKHFADLLNEHAPEAPSIDDFILLLNDVTIGFPAGTAYSYSDIGMMVLAIISSKAANSPFNELMRERIFMPAGMNSYFNNPQDKRPDKVTGYTLENWSVKQDANQELVLATDQRTFGGAGSIFVTLDDMIKWNNALNQNIILQEETKKLLWEKIKLPSDKMSGNGLGLMNKDYPGGFAVGHDGVSGTEYWKFPDFNTDIILLTNHGNSMASKGLIALVADKLGLLDVIDQEFFLNAMQIEKSTIDGNCIPIGKFKIMTPMGSYYFLEFYQDNGIPFVIIQGIPIKLIHTLDCTFAGYSKALFFPGLMPPNFEVKENEISWIMGPQKIPLTKVEN